MSIVDDQLNGAAAPRAAQLLALETVAIDLRLARRLPPAVAFRYHALLLAEGKSGITVAMANPHDQTALEAVTAALGKRPYVVQSEAAAIDIRLAEIWPEQPSNSSNLLVYHRCNSNGHQVQEYVQYLGDLLHAECTYFPGPAEPEATFDQLVQESGNGYDLIVFGEPDQSVVERLLSGRTTLKVSQQVPAPVLIARQPRWPLKRMLLVTRGLETDDVAVEWLIRLAQPSCAAVTVLAVVPAMHNHAGCRRSELSDWLATDTVLGRQLRCVAQRLGDWDSEGTLRFRQGPPQTQIECEVIEGDYDLIVIAADSSGSWQPQAELVSPLLHWAAQPVLVAKPTAQ